jgi:elongation factor P
MSFLYKSGNQIVLMDPVSFEQIELPDAMGPDYIDLLPSDTPVVLQRSNGNPVRIEAPKKAIIRVEKKVGENAISATGIEIQVPMMVSAGDRIEVDTNTGKFLRKVHQM